MPPALIVSLILQYGIPAARQIIELARSKAEPSLDDWLTTLAAVEVNAQKFLERTKGLDAPPTDTSTLTTS